MPQRGGDPHTHDARPNPAPAVVRVSPQVEPSDIVRSLFMKGINLSMNQVLDRNTIKVVASEYDVLVVDRDDAAVAAAEKKSRRLAMLSDEDIDDLVPAHP